MTLQLVEMLSISALPNIFYRNILLANTHRHTERQKDRQTANSD